MCPFSVSSSVWGLKLARSAPSRHGSSAGLGWRYARVGTVCVRARLRPHTLVAEGLIH